jgi:hypothetical protein
MGAGVTTDEALVVLSLKTGLTEADWGDFLAATPAEQAVIAKSYADSDWTRAPDRLAEVLAILGVLVQIAGAVSGISGAIGAVAALKAL